MHTEDESGGFWPGYVAAVASLVLSLLLIAAVLALTIYQVGLLAGKKVQAAAQEVVVPASEDASQPGAERVGEVVLEFGERGWRLDTAAQEKLREQIAQLVRRGAQQWQLSLRTDTEDPLRLRAGYLRLLAARNVLLEAGVTGAQIHVRLVHAEDEQDAGRELRIVAEMGGKKEGGAP